MTGKNNAANYQPTQYNVLVGAANNNITNVAPSATSGVPVISQGSSANPTFGTCAIAGGGTNATSYTATNGILIYDGTSFVNYSGTTINSSGVYRNTNQPAASGYYTSAVTNATGDNTSYTLGSSSAWTIQINQSSSINASTGTFTAPSAGLYLAYYQVSVGNLGSGHTSLALTVSASTGTSTTLEINPYAVADAANGVCCFNTNYLFSLTASQTISATVVISGSTKTATINGLINSKGQTLFYIYKVA